MANPYGAYHREAAVQAIGCISGEAILQFFIYASLLTLTPLINYVYHKMLLNENESYLVLVAKQILSVTINKVYKYKARNNILLTSIVRIIIIN